LFLIKVAMAIAFLSLMVILASVEAGRKPFTAFNKYQVDLVHGSGYAGSRYSRQTFQPVVQRSFSYPKYAQYTPASAASTRFQPLSQDFINNFGLQDTGRRNFVRGQEPSNRFTSGNIVQNAKAQAEETIRILKAFEGSSIAAEYIEPTFATSDCLTNLEDVTKLIQAGTDLIVDNGPELIYLEALVQSLKGETDVVKLTKATAKMLRALDGLGPALAAGASDLCISSPEASIKGFQDLADVLEELSKNNDINMPQRSRELLKISAEIMDQTAEFLETQNNALETFRTQCESGNDSQIAIYDSTREILDSLAKLYEVMGFEDRSVDLKKQSDFIKKFGDSYSELDRLGIDIDCSLVGDYKSLAQILEDLVVIIESVGLEKLSEELGINFDFNSV